MADCTTTLPPYTSLSDAQRRVLREEYGIKKASWYEVLRESVALARNDRHKGISWAEREHFAKRWECNVATISDIYARLERVGLILRTKFLFRASTWRENTNAVRDCTRIVWEAIAKMAALLRDCTKKSRTLPKNVTHPSPSVSTVYESAQNNTTPVPPSPDPSPDEKDEVVLALQKKGVKPWTVKRLVQKYECRYILTQIAALAYRKKEDAAAVLVAAIQRAYSLPNGYKAALQARKEAEAEKRLNDWKDEKEEREREQQKAEWDEQLIAYYALPPEERERWMSRAKAYCGAHTWEIKANGRYNEVKEARLWAWIRLHMAEEAGTAPPTG